jgi:hypothetical protein
MKEMMFKIIKVKRKTIMGFDRKYKVPRTEECDPINYYETTIFKTFLGIKYKTLYKYAKVRSTVRLIESYHPPLVSTDADHVINRLKVWRRKYHYKYVVSNYIKDIPINNKARHTFYIDEMKITRWVIWIIIILVFLTILTKC